ncbi:Uncharacterised protein at_DN1032 [Pycnogonum litorale]
MLDQPDASMVVNDQPSHGVKRKLSEHSVDDGENNWCESTRHNIYMWQRQSVLNISMCKLNHYRQVPNPSLRRSVLIFNTLRNIEEEMRTEMMEASQEGGECITATPLSELPGHMPTGVDNAPASYSPHPFCNLDMDQSTPSVPLFLSRSFCQNPDEDEVMVSDSSSSSSENSDGGVKYFLDLDSTGRATPYINDSTVRTNNEDDDDDEDDDDWGNHHHDNPSIMHWSTIESFSNQSENSSTYHKRHFKFNTYNNKHTLTGVCNSDSELSSSNSDSAYSSPSSNCSASSTGGASVLTELDLSLYDFDLLTSPLPQSRLPALSAEELIRTFPAGQQPSMVCPSDSDTSDDSDSNDRVLVGL